RPDARGDDDAKVLDEVNGRTRQVAEIVGGEIPVDRRARAPEPRALRERPLTPHAAGEVVEPSWGIAPLPFDLQYDGHVAGDLWLANGPPRQPQDRVGGHVQQSPGRERHAPQR